MAVPKRKKKHQKIIKPHKIGSSYKMSVNKKISKSVIESAREFYKVYKSKIIKNSSYLKVKRAQKIVWYSTDELTKHLERPKKLFSGTKQEKIHNRYLIKRIDQKKKKPNPYLLSCMYKDNFWRIHLYNTIKSKHYNLNMNRQKSIYRARVKKTEILKTHFDKVNKLSLFL